MTERTEILIGKEAVNKLKNSHVAVFGLGGVGGYVVEMLARAGVGELTLVDFDTVAVSNLNRQIIALNSTIGKYKTEAFETRLKDINPDIKLNIICNKYLPENSEDFFKSRYDYVVDAIDIVTSKIHLIATCHQKGINIVSAMGAGNRSVVPKFEVADIYHTYNDGLAKILRKKLRELGVTKHTVVFTPNIAESNGKIIGSISYYTAMCGCTLAGFVINELIKWFLHNLHKNTWN